MDSINEVTRVLDLLAQRLGVGVVIVDPCFRWKWMNRLAASWIESDPHECEAICDRMRAASETMAGAPEQRSSFVVEGRNHSLVIAPLGEVGSTGDSLWLVEDRTRCERSATNVRSTAACGDFGHLVRAFHHDIKTPLNALNLQIALQDRSRVSSQSVTSAQEEDRVRAGSEALRREVMRVDRLIGEFAAPWYRIEYEPVAADLRATVSSAIDQIDSLLSFCAVRCDLVVPAEPMERVLRHDLLHHGLVNLLILAVDRLAVATLQVSITKGPTSVRIILPRHPERSASVDAPRELDAHALREAIRRDVALQELESAGARVLATEREGAAWFEIEFT